MTSEDFTQILIRFFIGDSSLQGIITQVIGVFGFMANVISYQQKTQKSIVAYQALGGLLFTMHFFLLGGIAGMLLNIIAMLRGVVFYFSESKNWAKSKLWLWLFSFLIIGVSVYSAFFAKEGLISFLPMTGMIITTIALSLLNPFHIRLLCAVNSPLWLTYNVITGSLGGIMAEAMSLISIIVGIVRIDLKKTATQKS